LLPQDVKCEELIGDDAIVKVVNENVAIVENVDIFTPIHDDPFIQGEIVACNASNDIFAMGATTILSLQAFLAYPQDLPEEIPAGVLRGMSEFTKRLGAELTGGQTIKNPVPVFGGICLGIIEPSRVVYSKGAKLGDAIVLTKPLGVQPAMRSYRDLQDQKRDALLDAFSEPELIKIQDSAVRIMTTSNQEVAAAMQEVGVHAATDITGFGLLGHAGNVASLSCVDVVVERVPVIRGALELAEFFGHKLALGYGAETAGGMLVFMQEDRVQSFEAALAKQGQPCWTIGHVVRSTDNPSAQLADDVEFIETDFP
jgi:selenide,water dikinase